MPNRKSLEASGSSLANPKTPKLTSSNSLSSLFSLNGNGKAKARDDDDNKSITSNASASSRRNILKRSESLFSLVSPLMKKKKREASDDEDNDDVGSIRSTRSRRSSKRQRRLSIEQETAIKKKIAEDEAALKAKEDALDAELEPQYRIFRPKGFHLNPPPTDRPIRVYADGVFDLFHVGHMKQLEQSKKALPNATLIVGTPDDSTTHKLKGLTVLNEQQRYESLRHCRWVDEVVEAAPWCVTPEFLKEHKIDYVAHDDLPYASADSDDIYLPVKEAGMFLVTQRTDGISTSDIITKIIKDYDKYLMRNFARGASRQDLNVSWLKKNELDLKRHVNQFRESFKTNFESASRDLYADFMGYLSGVLQSNNNSPATSSRGRKKRITGEKVLASDDESILTPDRSRVRSPISDFASKYSGGKRGGILNNVKGWVKSRMETSDDD